MGAFLDALQKQIEHKKGDGKDHCSKCGSKDFTTDKKGFSAGKAAIGAFAFGPIGGLLGTAGSDQTMIVCLKCGHRWKPGSK